jgi:hypothetical protein
MRKVSVGMPGECEASKVGRRARADFYIHVISANISLFLGIDGGKSVLNPLLIIFEP